MSESANLKVLSQSETKLNKIVDNKDKKVTEDIKVNVEKSDKDCQPAADKLADKSDIADNIADTKVDCDNSERNVSEENLKQYAQGLYFMQR